MSYALCLLASKDINMEAVVCLIAGCVVSELHICMLCAVVEVVCPHALLASKDIKVGAWCLLHQVTSALCSV
jgi:hypothetical protein